MFDKIDEHSATPKYYQLYLSIKNQIDNEKLTYGSHIPSEKELMDYFGVSRVTVRLALKKLEEKNYIKKNQGKKTVVCINKSINFWTNINNFASDLRREDVKLTSEVIYADYVEPSDFVSNLFEISENEKVFCLRRVRSFDDVKVVYSISYLKCNVGIDYGSIKFKEDTSLKEVFKKHNVKMAYFDETYEARIPDEEIKKLLSLDDDTAIFFRKRITYNENLLPFEFVLNYYNGNYFKYYIEKGKAE